MWMTKQQTLSSRRCCKPLFSSDWKHICNYKTPDSESLKICLTQLLIDSITSYWEISIVLLCHPNFTNKNTVCTTSTLSLVTQLAAQSNDDAEQTSATDWYGSRPLAWNQGVSARRWRHLQVPTVVRWGAQLKQTYLLFQRFGAGSSLPSGTTGM